MSAPLNALQAASEARQVLRDKFHELRDGMHTTLPRPLREAFYEKLIDAYNAGRNRCDVYITSSRADGGRVLGQALAEMQQLYADALRDYQEGMDVLATGGLVDDSPSIPKSEEPGTTPLPAPAGRRKRAGGL